jgi:hypothetical protein
MKKTALTLLLSALFASPSSLHAADCSIMAGDVPVVIPPPGKEFVEVGSEKRNFFEWVVPSRNRLVCAFVLANFLPRLKNPASGMGEYMLVELSRKLDEKNTEVTSAGFEKVVAGLKQQFADPSTLNQTAQATSEEINSKLKQLVQSKGVSIDKPAPLGTLFQTSDV